MLSGGPLQFSLLWNKIACPATSGGRLAPRIFMLFCALCSLGLLFWNPAKAAFFTALFANILFLVNFAFKFCLILVYAFSGKKEPLKWSKSPAELPTYTILLPCYKEEKETLQNLVRSISRLNYPKEKLDVKFLPEEDDLFTINNLKGIEHGFEVLLVPPAFPKTKPKACNFGLYFAKGDLIAIYDAEDAPDENQLLEAAACFEEAGEDLICVQCRLNFYNANKNLLSKYFALEYLAWFNALLPAAERLGMPIPLGGTSNHFKTQKLIEIGGWDPMNVAEDAELGMRIFKKGYKTQICQSYTMEEAPFKIQDWLPQRQRWMKGYLQTFACHLLDFKGNAKAGPKFFFGLCALVGFSFFSFLLVPFCFAASVIAVKSSALLKALIGINGFCSVLYFLSFFYICKKEGYRAAKMALYSVYFYFFLHCAAAIMGFWQFMARPFYWNKTPHSVK